MIGAPIFHVNGDDPEACVWVARLAVDFRQKFKKDVVIDMLCYRRRGHNEGDDPSMTQPYMYDVIDTKRGVRKTYTEALIGRGDISMKEAEDALRDYQGQLERVFNEVRELEKHEVEPSESVEADQMIPRGMTTAVDKALLARIGDAHLAFPEGFTVHPRVKPVLEKRREMAYEGKVDWAFGELLALGTFLAEGKLIRMSGQDTRRGTFTQRHSVIIDRKTGEEFTPLDLLTVNADGTPTGGRFLVYDSALSEYAAVGFEYGYSVGNPDALVLWEAQFGDFVNGAQSIIDEFISSGEAKWGQLSDVVLLLPHGHEGQGPDHTSGRIERFLQLWAEGSMTIAMPSTPANYFHLLRRHGLDGVHRPLIVFTPKSMLRNKAAVSDIRDFTEQKFRSIMEEPTYTDGDGDRDKVTRILLTSGKIYYELEARKAKDKREDVAIVRIEQLAPLPKRRLANTLDSLSQCRAVLLGAGGAGQPGRVADVRADAAGAVAGEADRDQAHLAARHVGAVVGLVEGARRRAAGDHRRGVRLERPSTPSTVRAMHARTRLHVHRPHTRGVRRARLEAEVVQDRQRDGRLPVGQILHRARAEERHRDAGEHGGRSQRAAQPVGDRGRDVGGVLAAISQQRADRLPQLNGRAGIDVGDPGRAQCAQEVVGGGVGVRGRGEGRCPGNQAGSHAGGRQMAKRHAVSIADEHPAVTARGYRNANLSPFDTRQTVGALMQGFAGKVAVVTGAGSGIGQALAIELGRSGASVAISDVDTDGLAVTEQRLDAIGATVKADRLDVTEREAFPLYADGVKEHFGKVNQIYNNAGIAFSGDVEVTQFKDIERVMDVDFWGVVNGTKVFLPHLIASGDGHVVNISSVFGLFAVPGQAAYNSAKFAVRGFTEALRQEMILAKHPVKVTTVHPGGIKTAIARNATVADGLDQASMAQAFDKAGHDVAGEGGADHSRRGTQEPGPRAGRPGRQDSRPGRARSPARVTSGSLHPFSDG